MQFDDLNLSIKPAGEKDGKKHGDCCWTKVTTCNNTTVAGCHLQCTGVSM